MYNFVNEDNLYSIDFSECPLLVSQTPVPTLSEVITEARRTGQMPYTSQRIPIPSYTDDLDSDIPFNSCDKIGAQVNAISFADTITSKEKDLDEFRKRKPSQPSKPDESTQVDLSAS